MTLKSDARKQKDAVKEQALQSLKGNRHWDEQHERFMNCNQLLMTHAEMGLVLRDPVLMSQVGDTKTLNMNVSILARDLKVAHGKLTEIYKSHSTKRGAAGVDDVLDSLKVTHLYHNFMQEHDAVILPTVMHIYEITGEAEKKADMIKQAELAAADPTHTAPIDVVFTEVQPVV